MDITSILTILIVLCIIGVVVWLLLKAPLPPFWRNLIVAAAVILVLLWLLGVLGGGAGLNLSAL